MLPVEFFPRQAAALEHQPPGMDDEDEVMGEVGVLHGILELFDGLLSDAVAGEQHEGAVSVGLGVYGCLRVLAAAYVHLSVLVVEMGFDFERRAVLLFKHALYEFALGGVFERGCEKNGNAAFVCHGFEI